MLEDRVRRLIRRTIRQSGRPASWWAAEMEISPSFLYAVLRGEKRPSPLILQTFGFRRVGKVTTYERVDA